MPVSETRLAVKLQDGATSGLRNLTTTYSRFSSTVANSGRSLSQFNRQVGGANLGGFASSADKAASSLSAMNKTMERLVYSASRYFVIYKAMGAVGNVWDTVVGGSLEYAKSLESNRIGIAGILKSMITLNGENVKWNDAMKISGDAMKSLQSEALRTAATSQELIETFRALLGPGLSSGMSIDQITKLSTIGTNAVRSLGLPTNQYVQELRSIITEGIRPASSTLATSLGITNKDIKEAKASAEGLYAFLMKRMQGFQDAVKYTSDTVSGRIARIEEGIQVGVSKGADTLYKQYSAALEKIADYLIPVPKKLGDQWEINPAFIGNVEKVAGVISKLANDLADIGSFVSPLAGVLGGGAFTAIGQLADKIKLIAGLMVTAKLAPYVSDLANMVTKSREAYEAQTNLGRALQAITDKLHGRTVALQKLNAEQNIFNASMDTFFAESSRINTINGMVNGNANSITNLALKWQRMGMDAKQAGEIQRIVLGLTASAHNEAAQAMIKHGDAVAANIEKTNSYKAAVKNAYDTELQAIRAVIKEQNTKRVSDKDKVTAFLNKEGDKKPYKWQIESTNELIAKLQALKLEEEQVYNLTLQYTNALKKGGQESAAVIAQQIELSARNFIEKQKNLSVAEREITLNNQLALQQSALANAYRVGGEAAYKSLGSIIAREQQLVAAMKARGIDTAAVEQRFIELMNAATSATDKNTTALLQNIEALIKEKEEQLGVNSATETAIQKANTFLSSIGGLSMGLAVFCDVLGQADEENKAWYESAGNAAMTAGMFAMAIGQISGAISGMIPMLAKGIEWLNKFSIAKGAAGLGSLAVAGGAVAAGVGAIVYNAYKNFEETGIASQLDEYGNEVSYNFRPKNGDEINPEDRITNAHGWVESNDVIGLKDYGGTAGDSGGKSKGRGGGGGASSVNKAEQSAAKMKQILADLNKETINLNGHTTAYEKVMAQATEKIASQEKEIVKAQQLGVDVSEVRNAQLEYQLAMEQKATEALQDEQLKYMKLDEDAANRIYTMGGTMEQQREVLGQRLEAHRAYLEELLASEIENKERRAQLESELAATVKQINDNSVYDMKTGWQLALQDLANQQINFKEQFTSAFSSIEGSLVNLVSGTESAKEKFKKFCEDVTKTILQSMAQIIIRGLITKAIMGAIGLGGGGAIGVTASDFSGHSTLLNFNGFMAKGGPVKSGGTYLVGENGPELLQMGSQSGRVFNNRQTNSMMSGCIENVKVEVVNQSGQEVKADNASVKFDGKTMIISTVIEAVNTNYMGMRSMLKGVATT